MDRLSSSLRKSLNSRQRSRGISASNADDDDHDPILFGDRHCHDAPHSSDADSPTIMRPSSHVDNPDHDDRREVIVKIDGDSSSSRGGVRWDDEIPEDRGGFEFHRSKEVAEDPPSRLIGQFLKKQRAVGGEMCLDMDDMEMDELEHHSDVSRTCSFNFPSPDYRNHSRDVKVQFRGAGDSTPSRVVDIAPDHEYGDHNAEDSTSSDDDDGGIGRQQQYSRRTSGTVINNNSTKLHSGAVDEQVLRCTSFQRRGGSLAEKMINKTKSRLIDVPDVVVASEKKSGWLGKSSGLQTPQQQQGKAGEEEEEDPLLEEDIPEEFKKAKINALTLAQWISLIIIVTALICTLYFPTLKAKRPRGLSLWKWEVIILVLICGRLVSGWAIRVAVFFIERNFLLRKRLLYFVYGVRKAVQNCIWLGLVLIAWHSMFDRKVEGNNNEFLQFVNKIMVCMLIGITLWLAKTLMVKVLASSFHVSKFFDRIQESLFNQYIIVTLSGPPWIEIHRQHEEEERIMAEIRKLQNAGAKVPPELRATAFELIKNSNNNNNNIGVGGGARTSSQTSINISGVIARGPDDPSQGITIHHLHRLNPKNVSAWNMKRLMKIVRHGVLSTLDEQIHCTPQDYNDSANQIRSENEAKLAARKIFRNVAKPKSSFIFLDDLRRFLREEEAVQVMNLLDGSTDCERISKAALKNWVVSAFRERRALALTLDDTKTAVKKLHQMVTVLVGIIIVLITLVILGIATGKVLLYISSQVVIVTFIFGNTCKTVFEAIIFLFVMHPFDVGDRCEVDGVEMVVEEMNILTTVFLRYDNQKIHYPNSTLALRPIGNFYRSPDMGDSVDFHVHIATPAEKIKAMNQRILSYVENKKEHFYSTPTVVLMNIQEMYMLKMSVWLRHRTNHQDAGQRWLRRSQVVEEMVKIFRELDIEYRLYPRDINVRSMPPLQSTRLPPKWQPPASDNPPL